MTDVHTAIDTIAADAACGNAVFATHGAIAARVARLLDDPDCDSGALGRLIAAEPVLAARVLSVANSGAYNPAGRKITDLKSAVTRLGFSTVRALASAVVVRQMQETLRSARQRELAAQLWEHTTSVAALARVIARRVTHQNPDSAFFAGIVHELAGFYLIARGGDFPGLLGGTLDGWHESGEIAVGRALLRALDVPAAIGEAVETLWSGYLALPPTSLGDTLLLANEIAPVESPLDALDGMSRKGMKAELEVLVDDATLSELLAESAAEIASLASALKD